MQWIFKSKFSVQVLVKQLLILILPVSCLMNSSDANEPSFEPTSNYETQHIHGWKVLVNKQLLKDSPELAVQTLALVGHQFYQIERRLPATSVKKLKTIRLWIEFNEIHHPCMAYHPDAAWLGKHGMNPDKAGCVEIANAVTFLKWTIEQPWMILHELAHAYHHQYLEGGFDNALVKSAFEQAQKTKLYDSVLRTNGRIERAYAATNPQEYFAEASEAYFGTNDFFPFVRIELSQHDPLCFQSLTKLWNP